MSVPATIRSQIEVGVLMALGAHDFVYWSEALDFNAKIFDIAPRRKIARIMKVRITLEPSDTYRVEVGYLNKKTYEWVSRLDSTGVYADNLNRLLLDLDNAI